MIFLTGGVGSAAAQSAPRPLIDGLTLAPGLGIYVGDLDGNPADNPIQHLATGRLSLLVGADRRFNDFSSALELHYNRIAIDRGVFELRSNILSLDLVGGYHFDIFRADFVRLLAGVGVTLLSTSYDRFPDDLEGAVERETRTLITFPVSMIVQERIRFGARFMLSDFLDSFEGQDGQDWLYFVHIGYRFDFGR